MKRSNVSKELVEVDDTPDKLPNDEWLTAAQIRKKLKYEKNPMRIKQLNKLLNGNKYVD